MENDPYAPRPDASKRAAAKHRMTNDRRPTTDESPAPKGLPLAPIALIAAASLLIGVLSYGLGQSTARPLQLSPTSALAQAFRATPTTAPAPTPEAEPTIPPTALPVPTMPPEMTPQTGQGMTSIDSAPVVIEQAPEAQPPPPPPPTATPVPEWPTSAPARLADFVKPDIKDRCQFIGCLGQQAVDLARAETCHALFWQYGSADPETIPEPDLSAVRGCIWEGLYR